MKTLLIVGSYVYIHNNPIIYSVVLYGQTKDVPQITFIGLYCLKVTGYASLVDECKKRYCDYFREDDFNIITMDWIVKQGDSFINPAQ